MIRMARKRRVYLGDNVFVSDSGKLVTITTEYGEATDQTIHLKPETLRALVIYLEKSIKENLCAEI